MPSDTLRKELRMLLIRCIFLNIAAYLISVPVIGFTLSFGTGLLLGTAGLSGSLLLLQISVKQMAEDAKRSGAANQRRFALIYCLRLLVFAAAFGLALYLRKWISPVAAAIPFFYPRLIYTAGAFLNRSGSKSTGKKRGE